MDAPKKVLSMYCLSTICEHCTHISSFLGPEVLAHAKTKQIGVPVAATKCHLLQKIVWPPLLYLALSLLLVCQTVKLGTYSLHVEILFLTFTRVV